MIADGWLERLGLRGAGQRRNGVGSRQARSRAGARGLSRRRMGRRPSPRVIAVCAALLAILAGGYLWLRDSSLVAVKRVSVTGVSGPDAARIRSALESAGLNMTTLDVRMHELNMAVAPYPVVKALSVSTQFPHGLRIRVIEQVPVGAITFDGRSLAVAADGTVLHDVQSTRGLPTIPLRVPPGSSRVTDPQALGAVAVLAAAPEPLLARVSQVTSTAAHGLIAQLRDGPAIYFGDTGRLDAKWIAVSVVLAASGSAGAVYIDVTDPQRPAAGAASTTTSSATTSPASGATTSPASGPASGATSGSASGTTSGPAAASTTPGQTGVAGGSSSTGG